MNTFCTQVLQPDFRVNYCRLWQALIQQDMPGVERYSRKLGAGDLYPLFACVLTARSWTAVNSGISSVAVTRSEVGFLLVGQISNRQEVSKTETTQLSFNYITF